MFHHFLNHLYSVGVASGVVTSCVVALAIILVHQKLRASPHLLPSILIVLGLSACSNSLLDMLIRMRDLPIWELPNPFNPLVGPLFLLRLRSLNNAPISLGQVLSHVLPFLVVSVVLASYVLGVLLGRLDEEAGFTHLLEYGLRVLSFAAFLHVAAYLYLCRQSLAQYRVRLEQSCSSLDQVNQDWMMKSLISLLIAFFLLTIVYLLNHHHFFVPINKSLAIIYTCIAYYLCFLTLTRPILLGSVSVPLITEAPSKYQKSGIDDNELKEMFGRLQKLMRSEKLYSNPELNVSALADQLICSSQKLSQCINTCAKQNFYEYVNRFRLEEVKVQLGDANSRDNSILSIAFESGFNSKATFNRYFKAQLGCTPSEYRKSQSIG